MATPRLRLPYGPDIPLGVPSTESLLAATLNVWTKLVNGHLADMTPMPRDRLHTAPQTTVYRYRGVDDETAPPVLLVPPLAAPARCFDLRRGCSLVEHLIDGGRRTYLVDYGSIAFGDRRLGLEHWIEQVIPDAIRIAAEDAGEPVHVAAWCLGGILTLLALADQPDLPVATVSVVASPFDVTAVPLIAPLRPVALLTGGRIGTVAYRAMGGAPAFLVKRMFQLSSVDKYVTKPLAILTHLDDRDFLAQIEAVDDFTANMLAYPGRTFGQLYHRFFRANDLAGGCLDIDGKRLSLDAITTPVLAVAGTGDTIAPVGAVHHLGSLLPKSPEVRLETAPGGHLGVLTGRGARGTTWALLDEWVDKHHSARTAASQQRNRNDNRSRA
jgi:polyhydroxyalkanoate synthase subunit PhaC